MHLNSMPASQSRSSYESSILDNFPTRVCGKSRFALVPKRKNWMTLHTVGVPLSLFTVLLTFFPMTANAQSAPARDYLNVPVNTARFFLSFLGTSAETAAESDLALPNTEAVSRLGSVSALWSFPLDDRYGGVALTGNYATVKVKSPLGETETSGFGDPAITFHANIFGAPALRSDEFARATPQTFSSFHLTVNAPLGSYDRNSAVNVGSNRWAFTPLLNLSITPDKGVSWIDLYAGGRFFTNNNAFRGAHHLSQKPLASFTTHYSHNIGQLTLLPSACATTLAGKPPSMAFRSTTQQVAFGLRCPLAERSETTECPRL